MLRAYPPRPRPLRDGDFEGSEAEAEAYFGLSRIIHTPETPDEITPRQMRLELLSRGITSDQVVALINTNPDAVARNAALIEWEYSTSIKREHPLVDGLAVALGLAPGDVDAMFVAAKDR